MNTPLMKLSFSFVLGLYLIKRKAENENDTEALDSLISTYPELFTKAFQEFINSAKMLGNYLTNRYGHDFTSMFEPESSNPNLKLN